MNLLNPVKIGVVRMLPGPPSHVAGKVTLTTGLEFASSVSLYLSNARTSAHPSFVLT